MLLWNIRKYEKNAGMEVERGFGLAMRILLEIVEFLIKSLISDVVIWRLLGLITSKKAIASK
jgi:hypothetical protein